MPMPSWNPSDVDDRELEVEPWLKETIGIQVLCWITSRVLMGASLAAILIFSDGSTEFVLIRLSRLGCGALMGIVCYRCYQDWQQQPLLTMVDLLLVLFGMVCVGLPQWSGMG
ncbi:MAG: hypothetical protein Kow00121_30600 [Elainellaceae cyanobacterium]